MTKKCWLQNLDSCYQPYIRPMLPKFDNEKGKKRSLLISNHQHKLLCQKMEGEKRRKNYNTICIKSCKSKDKIEIGSEIETVSFYLITEVHCYIYKLYGIGKEIVKSLIILG